MSDYTIGVVLIVFGMLGVSVMVISIMITQHGKKHQVSDHSPKEEGTLQDVFLLTRQGMKVLSRRWELIAIPILLVFIVAIFYLIKYNKELPIHENGANKSTDTASKRKQASKAGITNKSAPRRLLVFANYAELNHALTRSLALFARDGVPDTLKVTFAYPMKADENDPEYLPGAMVAYLHCGKVTFDSCHLPYIEHFRKDVVYETAKNNIDSLVRARLPYICKKLKECLDR